MKVYEKGGQVYKGSKPDGMSDEEYHRRMTKAGYTVRGHKNTEPDPKRDKKEPSNRGNPAAEIKKSGADDDDVGISELSKALSQLSSLVESRDPEVRKRTLLQKSMEGDLSDDETAELMGILGGRGSGDEPDGLAKSALVDLEPDNSEPLQKAIEVSEYVQAHHSGTVSALTEMAEAIEKSQNQSNQFQVVLAKAIVQLGHGLEDLRKSLDEWGSRPAAQRPRSAQTPRQAQVRAMEKSFAGGEPQGDKLSRPEVQEILEQMHVESLEKGMNGQAPCGEDLMTAISKYEQFNKMTKSLAGDVIAYAQRARRAAA